MDNNVKRKNIILISIIAVLFVFCTLSVFSNNKVQSEIKILKEKINSNEIIGGVDKDTLELEKEILELKRKLEEANTIKNDKRADKEIATGVSNFINAYYTQEMNTKINVAEKIKPFSTESYYKEISLLIAGSEEEEHGVDSYKTTANVRNLKVYYNLIDDNEVYVFAYFNLMVEIPNTKDIQKSTMIFEGIIINEANEWKIDKVEVNTAIKTTTEW